MNIEQFTDKAREALRIADEAASRLRVELDSTPSEIDTLDRRIRQLQIELEALKKETDPASQERRARIEQELANLQEQLNTMKLALERERELVNAMQRVQKELERAQVELEKAEREYDFGRAAELHHGTIPRLEQRLREVEAEFTSIQGGRMLKEEVDAEDIAEIVSKWTHIPVSKLMEAEIQKLISMEERLHQRVVGQDWAMTRSLGLVPSSASFNGRSRTLLPVAFSMAPFMTAIRSRSTRRTADSS